MGREFRCWRNHCQFPVDSENRLEVTIIEIGVKGGILACGTGITASDMAYYLSKGWQEDEFEGCINAKGGIL